MAARSSAVRVSTLAMVLLALAACSSAAEPRVPPRPARTRPLPLLPRPRGGRAGQRLLPRQDRAHRRRRGRRRNGLLHPPDRPPHRQADPRQPHCPRRETSRVPAGNVAASHLYNAAPKDGTVFANVIGGIVRAQLSARATSSSNRARASATWEPRTTRTRCSSSPAAGVTRAEELLGPDGKQVVLGDAGVATTNHNASISPAKCCLPT